MIFDMLRHRLNVHTEKQLRRTRIPFWKNGHGGVIDSCGQSLVNFSSNDYLGLSSHPLVKKALRYGVSYYGAGSGGSALVSGYSDAHRALEEAFAAFFNHDRAILFNSGYHANLGVLSTLTQRTDQIYIDKHAHASLIDGALLSRARYHRYHHCDDQHLEQLLQLHQQSFQQVKADGVRRTSEDLNNTSSLFIVTDSVFSVNGDIADVPALVGLAKRYDAMLIVDDAHGVGVLGATGRGIASYYDHLSSVDFPCVIAPLGKAFANLGAIVSGCHVVIETLVQFSRTYHYTTALPPAICCAILAALNCMQKETWRIQRLHHLIQFFIHEATERGLSLSALDPTPIKSIRISHPGHAFRVQQRLMEQGFLVACMRPPTSTDADSRIRISLNCQHEEKNIIDLIEVLVEALVPCGI